MRILIVDDSAVYRSKIRAALTGTAWIEIVGSASNGKTALEMLSQKPVDLVTLDMEMPTLDGLQTLRALRQKDKATKVIVFSSSTLRGSEATLEALASGADDFVTKPMVNDGSSPEEAIRRDLLPKIAQFRAQVRGEPPSAPKPCLPSAPPRQQPACGTKSLGAFKPAAIVIASSTGGPTAHEAIFKGLGKKLRCPIFIAQHMPPVFTTSFAGRIASFSGLPCKEAIDGEVVTNSIYVAPGDFHLLVKRQQGRLVTLLSKLPQRNSVRPAADFLFESAAETYGEGCMGFVLTGMGEDGLAGAKAVKSAGGGIMIQDEKSCVVFGMPGAVFAAKSHDGIGNLEEIRRMLERMALE